jgi:hypothetical protein
VDGDEARDASNAGERRISADGAVQRSLARTSGEALAKMRVALQEARDVGQVLLALAPTEALIGDGLGFPCRTSSRLDDLRAGIEPR